MASTTKNDPQALIGALSDLLVSLQEGADSSQADTPQGMIRNARTKRTPAKRTARTSTKRTSTKRTPAKRTTKRTTKRTPVSGVITCDEAWQALGSDPTYAPSEPNAPARNGQLWALNAAGKLALID